MDLANTVLEHFSDIPDFRLQNHNFRHKLLDILVIAVLGTICGADGWTEINNFAVAKQDWLGTFLELPHGIPSHDTLGRIFAVLDPAVFETAFLAWLDSLTLDLKKEVVAIDGKTVRGSGNKRKGDSPIHLVSAWAAKNRMMLAQVKTAEKSNEITAIPKLLKMLDVSGIIVTIDAMGCQTKIAKQICAQGADYGLCCNFLIKSRRIGFGYNYPANA